ncbi:hypothetical protein ACQPZA_13535 [Pseudonocardia xinjiangensis]|uniref:hypothetical protein n=1 Tax=Pseudonocardia xinjiangensis TaxID=75289 RepID=UPI003D8DCD61
MPACGNSWAADVVDRLTEACGRHLGALWKFRLNRTEAPALAGWLARGDARLGDLLRDPDERAERLDAVVLMILRPGERLLAPGDDEALAPDDELLLAGRPPAGRSTRRCGSTPSGSTWSPGSTCRRAGSGDRCRAPRGTGESEWCRRPDGYTILDQFRDALAEPAPDGAPAKPVTSVLMDATDLHHYA